MEFRILSGESKGAVVSLYADKAYRVGPNFDCDVYLPLPAEYQQQHDNSPYFECMLQDDFILFQNVSCPVVCYPNRMKTSVQSEESFAFPLLLEFWGIRCVICDPLSTWEEWEHYLSSAPEGHTQTATETLQEQFTENHEASLSPEEERMLDEIPKPDTNPVPSRINRWIEKYAAKVRHIPLLKALTKKLQLLKMVYLDAVVKNKRLLLGFFFGVFFIFLGAGAYWFTFGKTLQQNQKKQEKMLNNISAIRKLEMGLPAQYSNLKLTPSLNGKVILEGVVKDKNDVEFLENYFSPYTTQDMEMKLLLSQEAIKMIHQVIQGMDLKNIWPQFNETSYRISLMGILEDIGKLTDLELAMSSQIPAAGDIDTSQVYGMTEIDSELSGILSKNNYEKRLVVEKDILKSGKIDITGYLTQSEITDLKSNVDAFIKKYSPLISLRFDVRDALESLPIRISEVHVGNGFPYLVTQEGEKIYQGGVVDGVKVERISNNEIVFSGKLSLVLRLDSESLLSTAKEVPRSHSKSSSSATTQDDLEILPGTQE